MRSSTIGESLKSEVILAPRPGTEFCRHNGRLALFHPQADQVEYWRAYWEPAFREQLLRRAFQGDLDGFERVLHHIPRSARVLDAGCGPARLVAGLGVHGYKSVVGLDYEPEVVRFVRDSFPEIDIRNGDVRTLPFGDASFGAYVSLGIVEHFEEGPDAALAEAHRVLEPRGWAVFEVPVLNPLRARQLARLKAQALPRSLGFHQYYFGVAEFQGLLERAGFEVISRLPDCMLGFLTREHPWLGRFWRSRYCQEILKAPLRRLLPRLPRPLADRYAHMVIFVCRRMERG